MSDPLTLDIDTADIAAALQQTGVRGGRLNIDPDTVEQDLLRPAISTQVVPDQRDAAQG